MAETLHSVQDTYRLERIIVNIPWGTSEDMIDASCYQMQHGSLEGYPTEKFKQIHKKQEAAIQELSDAFKRITLFEVAGYIADTFAAAELKADSGHIRSIIDSEFERLGKPLNTAEYPAKCVEMRDFLKKRNIDLLLHSQMRLMGVSLDSVSFAKEHSRIKRSYEFVSKQIGEKLFSVGGKTEGVYLFNLAQVLDLCRPDNLEIGKVVDLSKPYHLQRNMNVRFGGRHIRFSVSDHGIYQAEIDSNPNFAAVAEKNPLLFAPAIGRIVLESPEEVDYANRFLDNFAMQHPTLEPSQVRCRNGRTLEEQFRIEDQNVR